MSEVVFSGAKMASRWTPPLTEISTPGKSRSGRNPSGLSASSCFNATLSRSTHAPLLWSVTATQSISARMKSSSHSLCERAFSSACVGPLP